MSEDRKHANLVARKPCLNPVQLLNKELPIGKPLACNPCLVQTVFQHSCSTRNIGKPKACKPCSVQTCKPCFMQTLCRFSSNVTTVGISCLIMAATNYLVCSPFRVAWCDNGVSLETYLNNDVVVYAPNLQVCPRHHTGILATASVESQIWF